MPPLKEGPLSLIKNEIDRAIEAIRSAKMNPKWENNEDFDNAIQMLINLKNSL